MQSILGTVAGPEEKLRAQKLFENVEIVEDKLSERAFGLKLSDKISERSKVSVVPSFAILHQLVLCLFHNKCNLANRQNYGVEEYLKLFSNFVSDNIWFW